VLSKPNVLLPENKWDTSGIIGQAKCRKLLRYGTDTLSKEDKFKLNQFKRFPKHCTSAENNHRDYVYPLVPQRANKDNTLNITSRLVCVHNKCVVVSLQKLQCWSLSLGHLLTFTLALQSRTLSLPSPPLPSPFST